MKKNEIYRLEIERYSSEGLGIARLDGRAVFIKNAIAGEVCDVKLIKLTSSSVYGKIEELIVRSPYRAESACPYFGACGGCDFWHMDYDEELRLKKARVIDALQRIGGAKDIHLEIIGANNTQSYRNKAQYPVQTDKDGAVISGFYRARSHQAVPIERCLIQDERSDKLAAAVREWMERFGVTAYDEMSGHGIVRHIYVRTARGPGALLCVIANSDRLPHPDALAELARTAYPALSGVVLSVNKRAGNVVLGDRHVTLWGCGYLEDELAGLKFRLSPSSFYQVNPNQTELLYKEAARLAGLTGRETLLDLYCGIGTITLSMARDAGRAVGVDIVPAAIEDAVYNAALNNIKNVEFICGDAGGAAGIFTAHKLRPDVITVDPPRKGLSEELVMKIAELAPGRVVYVSCDPATMARDVKRLGENGYMLRHVTAVDMFPRTANVETVVLLSKLKDSTQ